MYSGKLKFNRRNRPAPKGRGRSGAAAVEAAFCIPVVIALMFGTLETCSGIFLNESLKIVAYEGVRVGVRRGATLDMVQDRCEEILAARHVNGGTVTITPSDFGTLSALEPITVTVEAPYSGNSNFTFSIFTGRNSSASVAMMREFDD